MQFAKGSPSDSFIPLVPQGVFSGNVSISSTTDIYFPGMGPALGRNWQIFSVSFALDQPSNITVFSDSAVTPNPPGSGIIFSGTDGIGKVNFGMYYGYNGVPVVDPNAGIAVSVSHSPAFILYYTIVFGRYS